MLSGVKGQTVTEPLKVGIYARLSQDRDGESTSTKRQADDCRKLAELRGWDVIDTYEDRNLSGFTGTERPEFERLVADLESGRIGGAVAWKWDRFGRNRADHNRLMILAEQKHCVLATAVDGVDTSSKTGGGHLLVEILAAMARQESENISTRTRRALEERATKGHPHTSGGRAFGFTPDWQQIPAEVDAVREATTRLLKGDSLGSVVRDFNERGILTARGNGWSGANLRRTITSPYVAGMRTHRGALYEGTWTPILDRGQWEQLRSTLERRGREIAGGGWKVSYLLTGLARCHCGGPMNGEKNAKGVRRYRCRSVLGGCGRVGILAEGLEGHVAEAALSVLDADGLAEAVARRSKDRPDVGRVMAELDAAEERLLSLAGDYGAGLLSRAEMLAARDGTVRRIEQLRAQLAEDDEASVLTDLIGQDLRTWWDADTTTTDRRRALLSVMLEAVVVGPVRRGGRGFDQERIGPDGLRWRV